MSIGRKRHRLLAPEVVQTSAMDCGPASLKCLLEGFGIRVSYGRLREACQTDVDGTSIDTMEEVAIQLGLDAEQVMIPPDHVLIPESGAMPSLVVVRLASGVTHFVVLWRTLAGMVQVMDPGTGRRWTSPEAFRRDLYIHRMPVPAAAWREWAESDNFLRPLRVRLLSLGLGRSTSQRLIQDALSDSSWHGLGALDAATRMTSSLIRSGALPSGGAAGRILQGFVRRAVEALPQSPGPIPAGYWTVASHQDEEAEEPQLMLTGAVLLTVKGQRDRSAPIEGESPPPLPKELVAALEEPPARPGRDLLRLMRADGLLTPSILVMALFAAAAAIVIEAVLFRGLLELGTDLALPEQRLGGIGAVLLFGIALLLVELPLSHGLLRLGRRLETRLRMAFLEKIPRLGDRYFQSRLTSDMAERSHTVHMLRGLPKLGGQLLRSLFALSLTTIGIAWLDPASAPLAITVAALSVAVPLLIQKPLTERDLRLRNHTGALSRFYLDSLLGLIAIRTHGAERSVRREHEGLLVEWARAGRSLQRAAVAVDGLLSLMGFGLSAWLLIAHLDRTAHVGSVLLLVYWALRIPELGQELAQLIRQYPSLRSTTLRLLEPLGAPEEPIAQTEDPTVEHTQPGVRPGIGIELENVSVVAAGHSILREINLEIPPGMQVGIVGSSGAGKSSFVGLLLGWHRPAAGTVKVDGKIVDATLLEQIRQETAWVDPSVQLWNRSLLDNLHYGTDPGRSRPMASAISAADLRSVLEKMPDGLQTHLGEGGSLVSGGEGQRVRLARAMIRPGVRLVILDEPFRGLDRNKRRLLLERSREHWAGATLLCITHDVSETLGFERVIVIEHGRVVEDGDPNALAADDKSRYRALIDAEEEVRTGLWASAEWRRLRLERGELSEKGGES